MPTYSLQESGSSSPGRARPCGPASDITQQHVTCARETHNRVSGPACPHRMPPIHKLQCGVRCYVATPLFARTCWPTSGCRCRVQLRSSSAQFSQKGLVFVIHLDCLPRVHACNVLQGQRHTSQTEAKSSMHMARTKCDNCLCAPWHTSRQSCFAAALAAGRHRRPSLDTRFAGALHA